MTATPEQFDFEHLDDEALEEILRLSDSLTPEGIPTLSSFDASSLREPTQSIDFGAIEVPVADEGNLSLLQILRSKETRRLIQLQRETPGPLGF